MKKLDYKNLPMKLPVIKTIVFYLLLDKFQVNNFIWGIFITLFLLFWIASIIVIAKQQRIDIFKEEKITKKSIFKQRLEDMSNKK